MVDLAMTDIDSVRHTCTRAVRAAKGHLHICLKLLGIINKGGSPEAPSTLLAEAGGDDLYLAMVMLNSSLLKALHVVDSFQLHCYRELPHGLAVDLEGGPPTEQDELLPFCIDDVLPILPDSQQKALNGPPPPRFCGHIGADEAAGPGGPGPERCTQRVGAREYRRLQAQCLILDDSVRAAEQHQELDAIRITRLQEECKQLRLALERCAAGLPPLAKEKPTRSLRERQEAVEPETLTVDAEDVPLTLTYRRRLTRAKAARKRGAGDDDDNNDAEQSKTSASLSATAAAQGEAALPEEAKTSSATTSAVSAATTTTTTQAAAAASPVEVAPEDLHRCAERARALRTQTEDLRGAAKSSRAVVEAARTEISRIQEEEASIRKLLGVGESEDLLGALKALVDDVGNFDPKATVLTAGGELRPDAEGEPPSMHLTSRSSARGRGLNK